MSSMAQPHSAAVPETALTEAAAWLVQLHATDVNDQHRAAFDRWHGSSPAHAAAWQRAETLMGQLGSLGGLSPGLNTRAMEAAARSTRRQSLRQLGLLLVVAPAGWLAWQHTPWREWTAEHTTARGEIRSLTLADGTQLQLDTLTRLDTRYSANQRLIVLRSGRILVTTGQGGGFAQVPALQVQTAQGLLRPIGTRFVVAHHDRHSTLAVLEGAVEVTPKNTPHARQVLQAGQQTQFTASEVRQPESGSIAQTAWTQGLLMADRMPLSQLADALARYYPASFRVHPRVADLAISGAYPLQDVPRTLGMLQATYPLHISRSVAALGREQVVLAPR